MVGYFHLVPDYQILLEEVFEYGNAVVAFGTAGGTYAPNGELLEPKQVASSRSLASIS